MQRFMRSIIVGIMAFLLVTYVACAQEVDAEDTLAFAQIAFQKTTFDFGDLNQGEKIEHIFEFRNIGKSPLILSNVLTTCGCTVPEWSKAPVPHDSTGIIKVAFDSTSKIGRQNKVVTIRSNSKEGDFRLRISGMVLPSSNR
jgi:hypothetical protein